MKQKLFILHLLTLLTVNVFGQAFRDDYKSITTTPGTLYYTDNIAMIAAGDMGDSYMKIYTQDELQTQSRVHLSIRGPFPYIGNKIYALGGAYFNRDAIHTDLLDYADYWADYRGRLRMLPSHLNSTYPHISISLVAVSVGVGIFANIPAIDYVEFGDPAKHAASTGCELGTTPFIGKGVFRDCVNLKYLKLEGAYGYIDQDFVLGCRSLEVLEFEKFTDPRQMLHIFHTDYQRTGHAQYPNLKAIVFPDAYVDHLMVKDVFTNQICKAVAEGHCRLISHTEFYSKRLTGLSFTKTNVSLDLGTQYSQQVTYAPTDAYHKSVSWSSSNPAVAFVSSEGVVTTVSQGTATITATGIAGVSSFYTVNVTGSVPNRFVSLSTSTATSIFDTYNNIWTVTAKNADGVIDMSQLTQTSANSVYSKVEGIIFENGVKEISGSPMTNNNLNFVYYPPTCRKIEKPTEGKIEWMFIMNRDEVYLSARDKDKAGSTITNLVYHGLSFPEDVVDPTTMYDYGGEGENAEATRKWLKKVSKLYASRRAKETIIDMFFPYADSTFYLKQIPYPKLFEDIKHKDATYEAYGDLGMTEYAPHLAQQNVSLSRINKTHWYINNDSYLELDPVGGIVYAHAGDMLLNRGGDATARQKIAFEHAKVLVFKDGITTLKPQSDNYTFLREHSPKVLYAPKSLTWIYNMGLNTTTNVGIYAGDLTYHRKNATYTTNHLLFLGDISKIDYDPALAQKTYAHSNLESEHVQYNLEAFDFIEIIRPMFEGTASLESINTTYVDAPKYLKLSPTNEVLQTTKDTIRHTLSTIAPAAISYDYDPAAIRLTKLNNNEFTVEPISSFNSTRVSVIATLPTGLRKVKMIEIAGPEVRYEGDIEQITLEEGGIPVLSNREVSHGTTLTFSVKTAPAVLTPRSIEWYVDGALVLSGADKTTFPYRISAGKHTIEVFVDAYLTQKTTVVARYPITESDTTIQIMSEGLTLIENGKHDYTYFTMEDMAGVEVFYNKSALSQYGYTQKVTRLPDINASEFVSGTKVSPAEFPITLYVFPTFPEDNTYGTYTLNFKRGLKYTISPDSHVSAKRTDGTSYIIPMIYETPDGSTFTCTMSVPPDVYEAEAVFIKENNLGIATDSETRTFVLPVNETQNFQLYSNSDDGSRSTYIFHITRQEPEITVKYKLGSREGFITEEHKPLNAYSAHEKYVGLTFHSEYPCTIKFLDVDASFTGEVSYDISIPTHILLVFEMPGWSKELTLTVNVIETQVIDIISSYGLNPSFSSSRYDYSIDVNANTSEVYIQTRTNAGDVEDFTFSLPDAGGVYGFDITSRFVEEETYHFDVRKPDKESAGILYDLKAEQNDKSVLSYPFREGLYEYVAVIPYNTTTFVSYEKPDRATVNIRNNTYTVFKKDTCINITVTSEDKSQITEYKLYIALKSTTERTMPQNLEFTAQVAGNWIKVYSQVPQTIKIYSLQGGNIKTLNIEAGWTELPYPAGLKYVILVPGLIGQVTRLIRF